MYDIDTIRTMNRRRGPRLAPAPIATEQRAAVIRRPMMDGEVHVLLRDVLDYMDADGGATARSLRARINAALAGRMEG